MQRLLAALAAELERPRAVTPQVTGHIVEMHGVARDEIGTFLDTRLTELADYEIELVFSPLFTPTLKDQAVFAELLGGDSIPPAEWPALIQQMANRPTAARLTTEDGQNHSPILREVVIERFVRRLRLDGSIPQPLLQLIQTLDPAEDRPMLKAIARRAIWMKEERRTILAEFLSAPAIAADCRATDATQLLRLTETHEPADRFELLKSVPHWQRVLRQEIAEAGGAKPFFNERVEELHGGGRDQRRHDTARLAARERELAFLDRLQRALNPAH